MTNARNSAAGLHDLQGFPLVINFTVLPLFFFSNALFPLKDLPRPLEIAVRFNPLTYGVDGVRSAFGHASQFGMPTDLAVLGGLAAVLLALGSYLFSRIELDGFGVRRP